MDAIITIKDRRIKALEEAVETQLHGLRQLQQILSPASPEQKDAVIREAALQCNTLEKVLWEVLKPPSLPPPLPPTSPPNSAAIEGSRIAVDSPKRDKKEKKAAEQPSTPKKDSSVAPLSSEQKEKKEKKEKDKTDKDKSRSGSSKKDKKHTTPRSARSANESKDTIARTTSDSSHFTQSQNVIAKHSPGSTAASPQSHSTPVHRKASLEGAGGGSAIVSSTPSHKPSHHSSKRKSVAAPAVISSSPSPSVAAPTTAAPSTNAKRSQSDGTADDSSDDEKDLASVFGAAHTSNSPMMVTRENAALVEGAASHIGALRTSRSLYAGSSIGGSLSARAHMGRDIITRTHTDTLSGGGGGARDKLSSASADSVVSATVAKKETVTSTGVTIPRLPTAGTSGSNDGVRMSGVIQLSVSSAADETWASRFAVLRGTKFEIFKSKEEHSLGVAPLESFDVTVTTIRSQNKDDLTLELHQWAFSSGPSSDSQQDPLFEPSKYRFKAESLAALQKWVKEIQTVHRMSMREALDQYCYSRPADPLSARLRNQPAPVPGSNTSTSTTTPSTATSAGVTFEEQETATKHQNQPTGQHAQIQRAISTGVPISISSTSVVSADEKDSRAAIQRKDSNSQADATRGRDRSSSVSIANPPTRDRSNSISRSTSNKDKVDNNATGGADSPASSQKTAGSGGSRIGSQIRSISSNALQSIVPKKSSKDGALVPSSSSNALARERDQTTPSKLTPTNSFASSNTTTPHTPSASSSKSRIDKPSAAGGNQLTPSSSMTGMAQISKEGASPASKDGTHSSSSSAKKLWRKSLPSNLTAFLSFSSSKSSSNDKSAIVITSPTGPAAGSSHAATLLAATPNHSSSSLETSEKRRERHCKALASEMIMTERDYLQSLRTLERVYIAALLEVCPVDEVKWIRLNLDRIIALSAELLSDMEPLEKAPIERMTFGQIFLRRAENIRKAYIEYVVNSPESMAILKKLQKNPKVAEKLEETRTNVSECNRLDLSDFLIKPWQRITRYPLLLRELAKLYPQSLSEYVNILSAAVEFERTLKEANERKQQAEEIRSLINIKEEFSWASNLSLDIVAGRKLVRRADFKKLTLNATTKFKGTLILLSDLLLVAQRGRPMRENSGRSLMSELRNSSTNLGVSNSSTSSGNERSIDRRESNLSAQERPSPKEVSQNSSGVGSPTQILVREIFQLRSCLVIGQSRLNTSSNASFTIVRAETDTTLIVNCATVEERDSWFNEINSCILSLPV